jgi:pyruvate dehydrogenase E2 component (dihydrolipoamide acetyltransferase)
MAAIRAFTMPKWGIEMTEGTLAQWAVKEGEAFGKGKILCLIETDKITNEVEAEFDSVLRKAIAQPGQTLPVGALLGVFAGADVSDADVAKFAASFKAADTSVAAGGGKNDDASPPHFNGKIETNRPISPQALKFAQEARVDLAGVEGSGRGGRITHQDVVQASRPKAAPALKGAAELAPETKAFASPLARRLAALHGVDLGAVKGTGPRGRISKADVLARVETRPAAAPRAAAVNTPAIVPMDKIRKVIARRLTEAKTTIPHFYLRASASVDELLALRKAGNLLLPVKASINDWLVKAVTSALVKHPDVNIQVHGEAIHKFPHADIAVAVATDQGLVTPILRAADRLRVEEIAAGVKALVAKAQARRLTHEDLEGGTFTLSNLGMFGVEEFDAIINPPQGAILAVGAAQRVWAEGENGQGRFETRISMTLSCDHRAIDGATGAAFLATLKAFIERPETLFAGDR